MYPKVRNSVVNLVDHINERTQSNIVEASRTSLVSLNERDLNTLVEIIDSSIKQGLVSGFNEIESMIFEIDKITESIIAKTETVKNKSKK
tara:strand:- start:3508 stop:3777 length:270 start_codon:yes stop_codon:yes gene_type:complete